MNDISNKALPPSELTWLYTHCRAVGMTDVSDSGKWEEDIALFVSNQQERIKALEQQAKLYRFLRSMRNMPEDEQEVAFEEMARVCPKPVEAPESKFDDAVNAAMVVVYDLKLRKGQA